MTIIAVDSLVHPEWLATAAQSVFKTDMQLKFTPDPVHSQVMIEGPRRYVREAQRTLLASGMARPIEEQYFPRPATFRLLELPILKQEARALAWYQNRGNLYWKRHMKWMNAKRAVLHEKTPETLRKCERAARRLDHIRESYSKANESLASIAIPAHLVNAVIRLMRENLAL